MANFNLNKVILGGRLTSDPEFKQTQTGVPMTTFRLAVNRRIPAAKEGEPPSQQQNADFFNVVAWRYNAEFVSRYFRKGSAMCLCGSIQMRQWIDPQGQKRYSTDIVADEIFFVDSKADSPAVQQFNQYAQDGGYPTPPPFSGNQPYNSAPPQQTPAYSGTGGAAPKFEEIPEDDDLPF